MSGVFRSPKKPKVQPAVEVEPISEIEEDAAKTAKRERKKLLRGGRRSTMISGIQAALKRRFGE